MRRCTRKATSNNNNNNNNNNNDEQRISDYYLICAGLIARTVCTRRDAVCQ